MQGLRPPEYTVNGVVVRKLTLLEQTIIIVLRQNPPQDQLELPLYIFERVYHKLTNITH